ncbi:tripartite tricarboxylate transporter substrate binding protein [Pusillimonas sp. TS35]|uniref:Bug family tripartite tricarboxylate transporter substrate binding protein n=1 Tax=Paracandidimonas lactea TaxID=2895524 RepID=UPI001370FA97|nr:tripartite tricarboxylate transporter substrate binding protein [Pusillimonas sp. TS35]
MKYRLFKSVACVAGACLIASGVAVANTFPERPIRIITPFQAGNVLDAATRDLADQFHKNTGKTMIVENRAGGEGVIAAQTVINAKDSGYSLLVSTTSIMGINPHLMKNLPYDPIRDFTHVSSMIGMTLVLAVRQDMPVNSLDEFIRWVKEHPKSITYASFIASSQYLGALLNSKAGIDMLSVPFNGTPAAVQNLMGGHVDAAILPLAAIKTLTDTGKLKVLAVSSPERSSLLPDVPTFREKGLDALTVYIWAGLSASPDTPPDVVAWLNKEIVKILQDPALKEKWARLDMTPLPSTSAEFVAHIQADQRLWGSAIDAAKFLGER